jgi:hypothetical protein
VLLAPTALLHIWQPYASLRPAGVCGLLSALLLSALLQHASGASEQHCSLSAVGNACVLVAHYICSVCMRCFCFATMCTLEHEQSYQRSNN